MKKIILVILNVVLLSIIWLSDGNYLDSLKKDVHQSNIVLSKETAFEPGKEIVWVITATEKQEMTDILLLELATPSVVDADSNYFQLQVDAYIEFDDGRKLTRMIVPSIFGQNMSGFTQKYVDPGRFDSRAKESKHTSDLYRVGQFVNLFWEPLTIKVRIVDVSDELIGKPFQMSLGSNTNHEVGMLYGFTQVISYLKISVAVICLFLLNVIYLKNNGHDTSPSSDGGSSIIRRIGSLATAIATTVNVILLAQLIWQAFRFYISLGKSPDYGFEVFALFLYALSNIIALHTSLNRTGILRIFRSLILGLNILLIFVAFLFATSASYIIVTIALLIIPAVTAWALLAQSRFKVTIYGMSLW